MASEVLVRNPANYILNLEMVIFSPNTPLLLLHFFMPFGQQCMCITATNCNGVRFAKHTIGGGCQTVAEPQG